MEFAKRSFSLCRYLIAGFVLLSIFGQGQSEMCTEKNGIFKLIENFSCPRPGEPSNHRYCCEKDDKMKCCSNPLGFDFDGFDQDDLENSVRIIVSVIGGLIAFIVVACVLSCCFCPCCLLYKRRQQTGAVYQTTQYAQAATVTVAPPAGSYPVQANYPTQPGHPAQSGYPTQPGYPTAHPSYPPVQPNYGYEPQGNAPPPGFAQQQSYPSYQPLNQNQPYPANDAYQKAPAYNPDY